MLRIHTSHRTEVLLEALVRELSIERKGRSAFVPSQVVVPNKNIETYLRLGVAERLGIAVNLETRFLRRALAGLAEQALPGNRMADVRVIEGHLLAILHDDAALAAPELSRVRVYLDSAGREPDAMDRRRCQLAARLAHLFDEYAGSRPDMLAAWRTGKARRRGDRESWQRVLWLAALGPGGRLERQARADGLRLLPLDQLWNEAVAASPATFAGRTLHVFGLSYIGTTYHRMLERLARDSTVHLYVLNPCIEAIESWPGQPADLPTEEDLHPALSAWARPGRENLRLLAHLHGVSVEASFPRPPPTTLLSRLQIDIANRRAPQPPTLPTQLDGSLSVLPCPSLRRELEVVAAEIWGLLRRDSTLRACDIAVVVPESSKDVYLAQIPAVFHESCELPCNLTDLPPASSHGVADAIGRLLDLPFSSFTRKELLSLLTHPCLIARYPEATADQWQRLAHDLGIVRGADREDFEPAYLGRDLYTWEQGLRRLALGTVMDRANDDAPEPLSLHDESYLPGPGVDSGDDARLGFGLLASALIADARFASGRTGPRERPLIEWLDFVRGMIRTYIVVDEDDGSGQATVARFSAALDELGESGLGDTKVSYRVAAELARRALGDLPASRGHYLASGVTVASFVPMRAIPFRAVFVLGLGQSAFPRPPGRAELDLRGDDRLPGDVDQHEQDLYMFLEALLSTRDSLCLSYVSRDEITGDPLPPSPLVLELRTMLGRSYLSKALLARLFCDRLENRPPLRRYDDTPERRAVLPPAQAEHDAKVRREPTTFASHDEARVDANTLPDILDIPLWALRAFLTDPLQGSARFRLDLRPDEDEDVTEVEDEDFDTSRQLTSMLVRESMLAAIVAAQGTPPWERLDAEHGRRALAAELSAAGPSGLFRDASLRQEKAILRAWHARLPELWGQGAADCRSFQLVPDADPALLDALSRETRTVFLPSPGLQVTLPAGQDRTARQRTIRIVGETGLWTAAEAGTAHALAFTCRNSIAPKKLGAEDLRAFLDHVALAASTGAPSRPRAASAVFYAKKETSGLRPWPLGALSRDEALDYLARLCSDLLVGTRDEHGAATFAHPYLLPFEAVLAVQLGGAPVSEAVEKATRGRRLGEPPVRDAAVHYAPPTESEGRRMIESRFGLFFRLTGRVTGKEAE